MASDTYSVNKKVFSYAALLSLVQSTIWLVFVILCTQTNECLVSEKDPAELNRWELVLTTTYLTYFWDHEKCSHTHYYDEWPSNIKSVKRTYYWIITTLVINALWMFSSTLLLFAGLFSNHTSELHHNVCFYYPWINVTKIVIVMDVLACLHYLLDIFHTTDLETYYTFIGAGQGSSRFVLSKNVLTLECVITFVPIIMSFIFVRMVVIWIINVILVSNVTYEFNMIKYQLRKNPVPEDNQNENIDLASLNSSFPTPENNVASINAGEDPYLPWVNILCIPSYDYTEKINEHYYEHVTSPNDLRKTLQINVNDSSMKKKEKNTHGIDRNVIDNLKPHPVLIDTNYFSIQICGKPVQSQWTNETSFLRIPRIVPKCTATNCRLHHRNNHQSENETEKDEAPPTPVPDY